MNTINCPWNPYIFLLPNCVWNIFTKLIVQVFNEYSCLQLVIIFRGHYDFSHVISITYLHITNLLFVKFGKNENFKISFLKKTNLILLE